MTPTLDPLEPRQAPAVLPVGMILASLIGPPPAEVQPTGLPPLDPSTFAPASATEEATQLGTLPVVPD